MPSLNISSCISSLRVIVVNKETAGGRELTSQARSCGFRTILCHSCQAVVPQLNQTKGAILLLEYDSDSEQVVEKIPWLLEQSESAHCCCAVVAVGGKQPCDACEEYAQTGNFQYIKKPVSQDRLKFVLTEAGRSICKSLESDENEKSRSLHSMCGFIIPYAGSSSLAETPASPGVLVLYDSGREPLYVEWSACLRRRLTDLVEGGVFTEKERKRVRYFEFLETVDSLQAAKVFDKFVNYIGSFPALMKVAPDGARHLRCPSVAANTRTNVGRVTQYNMTIDSKMVQKLRQKAALNPGDRMTCEWLAFALYSNNLLEEAIDYYQKLIDVFEPREEYYFYCANAFYKRGNIARAISMWRVACKMAPDTMIARKSTARADRAEALLLDDEELQKHSFSNGERIFPRLEDI